MVVSSTTMIPIKDTIIKDRQDQSLAVSSTFKSPATISVWNQRLGHLSDSGIQTLTKRAAVRILSPTNKELYKIRALYLGKAHRAPFPTPITTTTTTTKVNQFLHMDIAEQLISLQQIMSNRNISTTRDTIHSTTDWNTERKNQNIMNSARSMVIKSAQRASHTCAHYEINSEQCNALCSDTPQVPRPIAY
ncbi:hypothetical protein BASA83_007749 [Batrachochytrium salamandrivorans]|nr:hypothetical protein BASA83_007749 [Batrachochytrium salamandrivorans]